MRLLVEIEGTSHSGLRIYSRAVLMLICMLFANRIKLATNQCCASESMEAFAKKKGKVGTRGGGQIIKENDESLVFYRFVLFSRICSVQKHSAHGKAFNCGSLQEHDPGREWPVLFDHGCYG